MYSAHTVHPSKHSHPPPPPYPHHKGLALPEKCWRGVGATAMTGARAWQCLLVTFLNDHRIQVAMLAQHDVCSTHPFPLACTLSELLAPPPPGASRLWGPRGSVRRAAASYGWLRLCHRMQWCPCNLCLCYKPHCRQLPTAVCRKPVQHFTHTPQHMTSERLLHHTCCMQTTKPHLTAAVGSTLRIDMEIDTDMPTHPAQQPTQLAGFSL